MELDRDTWAVMRNWLRRKSVGSLIGVEFGPEGLAIAKAAVAGSEPALEYCAFIPEPRMDAQIQLLRELVSQQHWHKQPCNVVLHPSQYQISLVEAPAVPDAELHEAMRWRLRDSFGMSPDELAFDVAMLPDDAYRSRGRMAMLAATRRSVMEKVVADIEKSSLVLHSIDITEMAMHNLTLHAQHLGQPTALLRMRNSSTLLTISDSTRLYFARSIDIGLEAIRREQEMPGMPQQAQEGLVLEIQRSLDFFETQLRKGGISRLYVLPTKHPVPSVMDALRGGLTIDISALELQGWLLPDSMPSTRVQAYCLGAMGAALRRCGA